MDDKKDEVKSVKRPEIFSELDCIKAELDNISTMLRSGSINSTQCDFLEERIKQLDAQLQNAMYSLLDIDDDYPFT